MKSGLQCCAVECATRMQTNDLAGTTLGIFKTGWSPKAIHLVSKYKPLQNTALNTSSPLGNSSLRLVVGLTLRVGQAT
eukprot:363717-Chlamydomonas_euryale.AAC.9